MVAIAAAGIALRLIPSASALDRNVLAVLPFRVNGGPSLAYLREGMVDLLAARLNGTGGPRAVDPRAVIGAWRRVAKLDGQSDIPAEGVLRLARQLRAGQVLTGSVVETPTSLVLDAHLVDVSSNRPGPEAVVQGPPDSLLTLVDRLAAQVLARGAGERESHLASLTTTSLPALKAYLAGEGAYRQGRYEEAVRYFQVALSLDSTFGLAGISLYRAGNWIGDSAALTHGRAVAYAHCVRLSQVCVAPDSTGRASLAEQAALGEPAGELGDLPETWYELADPRFHGGSALGGELRASLDHAAAEFRRALELDSAYAPALSHLVDYSVAIRDTAGVQSYASRYLAVDSAGDLADYVRWVVATMTADSSALTDLRVRMPRMRVWTLVRIIGEGQLEGIGLDDRDRAAAVVRGRSGSPGEVRNIYAALHSLALNAGRPRAAVAAVGQWQELQPSRQGHDRRLVLDALFWGGDTTAAQDAIHRLSGYANAPAFADPRAHAEQNSDVCALELWALAHGDAGSAARAIARLRAPAPILSSDPAIGGQPCAVLLAAMLSSVNQRADRASTLNRLDSLLATGPSWNADVQYVDFGNLAVARLREEQGDLPGALAAIRRRSYEWWMPTFLSTYLREEGRLAALTGDRAGAIRAYQQYLALRSNPEPAVRPETDQVRTQLATLLGVQNDRRTLPRRGGP
jgi:tetratricopeptide (TPR) repeat protein